ncbi:MAG: DUF5790 family protein, partial [Halobacteria archaeon]|nr:DUF5790 family protein [Halobacteria archaeon]
MAQSTLDEEDLFSEASDEIRDDVDEAIEEARGSLPDADDVLDVEGDNIIGVLNGFKSNLDLEETEEALREAKKWFEIGKRADAFDDEYADETDEELVELTEVIDAA